MKVQRLSLCGSRTASDWRFEAVDSQYKINCDEDIVYSRVRKTVELKFNKE